MPLSTLVAYSYYVALQSRPERACDPYRDPLSNQMVQPSGGCTPRAVSAVAVLGPFRSISTATRSRKKDGVMKLKIAVPAGLILLLVFAVPVFLSAQPASDGSIPAYRPGLGDLMTMTVQPRHIKVGLALQEKNWPLAAYELHELEESFERVARYWPQWRKKPIAEMMTS